MNVVHEKEVGVAVFFPEFLVAAFPDGLDEFVGKGVTFDVDDAELGVSDVDFVGDCVEQVGFAQAGFSIDEEGVVALSGVFSDR